MLSYSQINMVPIYLVIRLKFFPFQKNSKKRHIVKEGSRFLGLFQKRNTCLIAKLHILIYISGILLKKKSLSYSQINMVYFIAILFWQYLQTRRKKHQFKHGIL